MTVLNFIAYMLALWLRFSAGKNADRPVLNPVLNRLYVSRRVK